jgi:hypothetical protein
MGGNPGTPNLESLAFRKIRGIEVQNGDRSLHQTIDLFAWLRLIQSKSRAVGTVCWFPRQLVSAVQMI